MEEPSRSSKEKEAVEELKQENKKAWFILFPAHCRGVMPLAVGAYFMELTRRMSRENFVGDLSSIWMHRYLDRYLASFLDSSQLQVVNSKYTVLDREQSALLFCLHRAIVHCLAINNIVIHIPLDQIGPTGLGT